MLSLSLPSYFFLDLFFCAALHYPNAWNRLPSLKETLFRLLLVEMNLPLRFRFRSIALGVIISSVSRKRKSQCCERALPKEIKVNLRFLVPWGKSRNAQKVCAVTIVGSVLKTSEDIALQSGEILLTFVWWWEGGGTNLPSHLPQHTSGDRFSLSGPCQKLKKPL